LDVLVLLRGIPVDPLLFEFPTVWKDIQSNYRAINEVEIVMVEDSNIYNHEQ
jgi:hypothetical protein